MSKKHKKWELPFGNSHFFFLLQHANGMLLAAGFDGGHTIIFLPQREEKCKSNPSLVMPGIFCPQEIPAGIFYPCCIYMGNRDVFF